MSFAAIGLSNPKFPENVGGVLRAAFCYDAKLVVLSGVRYRRVGTDTPAAYRHIPVICMDNLRDAIPYDTIPIAVDIVERAIPLPKFCHPDRAFYIFGQEDGTLSKEIMGWCKYKIYVPTTVCMNLAATVNVVLYDRMSKQYRGIGRKCVLQE